MAKRAIIIGAGRGSRLEHLTDEVPKTLVEVLGRPMLDHILEALEHAGFARQDVIFVAGYRAEEISRRYPELQIVMNDEWESNNILLSLMKARRFMKDGFVSTYADIVYRKEIARAIATSPHAIALGCDTAWRRRYEGRTQHPETDAEKMIALGDRVERVSRRIASDEASGEFIGVMKAEPDEAAALLAAFDRFEAAFAGKPFREGRSFEKAYLIDFLQAVLEEGSLPMHRVSTPGGYMEIDTLQDRELAPRWWSLEP